MTELIAATLYKFVELPDFSELRSPLLEFCRDREIKGTILLAPEGINGTIAGKRDGVWAAIDFLRRDPRLVDLTHRESPAAKQPFQRMKVRLKREIVTMGVPDVNPAQMAGTYVSPEQWNELLDDPEVVVVDVRNDYEVAIGTFEGAVDPHTQSFVEFPNWVRQAGALRDKPKVAMFCTGGIRCEKSTALLRAEGFEEVYHLQGGILNYLATVPESESRWQGECFVFDERVAVGHGLAPGRYEMCSACGYPIDESDRASDAFEDGVSCPHCFATTTDVEKERFRLRRQQFMRDRQP
ncbi:MAG: rhodanese-related sulfurtransferase [Cyanobacteria bacterium P01_D01_bin.123]